MKIVILERDSVGRDVSVGYLSRLGEVTAYSNTEIEEIEDRIKDANIIIANKSPLNEQTLKNAKDEIGRASCRERV